MIRSASSSSSSEDEGSAPGDRIHQESRGKQFRFTAQNRGKLLRGPGEARSESSDSESSSSSSSSASDDEDSASTSDPDSSHHSTLTSDSDPRPPQPHMRQAPPSRERRSSVDDEDIASAERFTVSLSALPLLLLQSARSPSNAALPFDILSPPVNSRHGIDHAKLVSSDVQHNILLRYIQNRSKGSSPIGSNIHGVLFSFTHDPTGECSSNPLKSLCTVDGKQSGGKFDVRGMTADDCARILKWLDPTSTPAVDGGDLLEGKTLILEKLGKLPLHGSFDQMGKKFQEKTWDKPGTEELVAQARKIIEGEHEFEGEHFRRITLWKILLKMIPYQLQMACAVVDGMHRMTTVLCASVGACPPDLDPDLKTSVRVFTNGLMSTEEDGSGMVIPSTGSSGAIVDINTQLVLVDWQPRGEEAFDSAFFKAMSDKSRALQDNDSSGDEHTARSVIHAIMCLFGEKLPQLKTGCLFRTKGRLFLSADDDCSMAKAFAAKQAKARPEPRVRYNQVKAFLEGSTALDEGIREAYLRRIEDNEEELGRCYTNYFSQIYTQLWVEELALLRLLINGG